MNKRYEKIIGICCFAIYFMNVGLPSTSFNVFQPYLVDLPYVGDMGGSFILGVKTCASFIAMFFVAWYYKRLNCRMGVFIASLCTCLGFFLFAFNQSFLGLCVAGLLAGIGYGLGGSVATTLLINRWFKTHVGTIVGFTTLGSGVSSLVLSPVVARIITASSLQNAFLFEAVLALCITIVLFVFLRNSPEEVKTETANQQVQSNNSSSKPKDIARQKTSCGSIYFEVSRRNYYLAVLAMALIGCITIGGFAYFGILLTSEGFGHIEAANFVAVLGASLSVMKFCSGYCFDKLGIIRGSIILFALCTLGLGLSCLSYFSSNHLVAFFAALCFGSGASIGSVGLSMWSIKLSPQNNFEKSVRNFQTAYAFGGFIFNIIPGLLKNLLGSYVFSYLSLLTFTVIAGFIICGTLIASKRLPQNATSFA